MSERHHDGQEELPLASEFDSPFSAHALAKKIGHPAGAALRDRFAALDNDEERETPYEDLGYGEHEPLDPDAAAALARLGLGRLQTPNRQALRHQAAQEDRIRNGMTGAPRDLTEEEEATRKRGLEAARAAIPTPRKRHP
jgi:hypothetical protein